MVMKMMRSMMWTMRRRKLLRRTPFQKLTTKIQRNDHEWALETRAQWHIDITPPAPLLVEE